MRTLPAPVTTAKEKNYIQPVVLVKIKLPAHKTNPTLTLRLAPRKAQGGSDFSAAGFTWKPLINSISRTADSVRPGVGMTGVDASMRLALVNVATDLFSPDARMSTIFQNYKPESATVTIYQWFDGESFTATELLEDFSGRIAAPVAYGQDIITFDVVAFSNEFGKRHPCRLFNRNDFPDLPDSTVGKVMPIPIGQVKKAPLFPVTDSAETVLTQLADVGDTVLNVADASKFPNAGAVTVNGNLIHYTAKTATTLTGATGISEVHYDGAPVTEELPEWVYCFGDPRFAIQGVNALYGGPNKNLIDPSTYTVDLAANLVKFVSRPKVILHDNTILRSVFLDQVDPSNTALDPENAFDFNETDKVAQISQANRTLALQQTDAMQDLGPISRAWVQVFHFADGILVNDSVNVEIDGLGVVGNLSKPAIVDKATVSSLVDIDHETFNDLTQTISPHLPSHATTSDAEKEPVFQSGTGAISGQRVRSNDVNDPAAVEKITINFPPAPAGVAKAIYRFTCTAYDETVGGSDQPVFIFAGNEVAAKTVPFGTFKAWGYTPTFEVSDGNYPQSIDLFLSGSLISAKIDIQEVSRELHFGPASPTADHTESQTSIKGGGVLPTVASKTPVNTTLKATNVAWNRIEITSTILANGGWSWLLNKIVKLVYTGSSDGRTVYPLGVNFEIEYARQRVEFVDQNMTADLDGIIDDSAGTITGTPNLLLERPDHIFKWSLDVNLGAKRSIALQLFEGAGDFDLFGGGTLDLFGESASYVDGSSFTAAGALYAAAGYKFAGVMLKDDEARVYWRSWARQCRSVLHAKRGRLFSLFYRPNNGSTESTTTVKSLEDTNALMAGRISSLRITRTPQDEIINKIDLKYAPDYLNGGFTKSAVSSDETSITRYGERTDPGKFEFDFVNDDSMAQSLLNFYLDENREPFKVATFLAHLNQLELELFDTIGLKGELIDGSGGTFKPGLIIGSGRQYGSGLRKELATFNMRVRLVNSGKLTNAGLGLSSLGSEGLGGFEVIDG